MKKLISIFAALALVGSLAAQKKKPAAKAPAAPAAPAVAAPAAPVVAAPAMPTSGAAAAGMGLFIEARGTFTMGQGTSVSKQTGDITAQPDDYLLANTSGFGGGATIGYEIAKGLGLVGSFDYRSISSRKWETTQSLGGANGDLKQERQQTTNTMVVGIGFRPSVNALGGTWYAGAGFAYVLPFENVGTVTPTCSVAAACGTWTGTKETATWNAGIGAYGELGFQYPISDNLYVGVGIRMLVATANNDGKDKKTVTTGTAAGLGQTDGTVTVTYKKDGKTAAESPYESQGITDVSATLNVGFRF